ncbi:MAG: prepilin-type N-terminal cleavage/methylation domain-containing protein [Tatlockia sp.]|nr:prepilin-type N-terminal cleavage/methylation domain-containing protein [Tatlockia sp.]
MKAQGFSIIEIIIVIMIIALFATFTYPSYRESITRARRIDGKVALLDLAARMEQYYAENQTYQGATLGTGSASDVFYSNRSAQNYYILLISKQTDTEFNLAAIPRGPQAQGDKACQTLSFNSFGVKGITPGPGGTPSASATQCW